MRRKIPSTLALTAFEAAARHQSYTKAADELAVTQSAVCRQIAGLEDFLGVRLFRRNRRGVALTGAGLSYCRQVTARLDEVERDTLDLMARGGEGGALELGVVPTFASKWLLPRMPAFVASHPGIHVNLAAQTRPFLFDDTAFDAAIYAGETTWPGTDGVFLMRENLVAVCSPQRLGIRKRSLATSDWHHHTLLQQSTRPYAWRQWFASRGMKVEGDMAGPRFELFSMLTEAAICGMGIALIPRFLIENELKLGLLVQVVKHAQLDRSYYLIYPEGKVENAALIAFRDWLQEQARGYRTTAGFG
jgi:DNA-binding transcriptional LysR family regulator